MSIFHTMKDSEESVGAKFTCPIVSFLPHLFFHWQYCQLFREYLAEREDYLRV